MKLGKQLNGGGANANATFSLICSENKKENGGMSPLVFPPLSQTFSSFNLPLSTTQPPVSLCQRFPPIVTSWQPAALIITSASHPRGCRAPPRSNAADHKGNGIIRRGKTARRSRGAELRLSHGALKLLILQRKLAERFPRKSADRGTKRRSRRGHQNPEVCSHQTCGHNCNSSWPQPCSREPRPSSPSILFLIRVAVKSRTFVLCKAPGSLAFRASVLLCFSVKQTGRPH